jgi:O-antigen ligase
LAPALGGGTSPLAIAILLTGIGIVTIAFPAAALRPAFLIGASLILLITLDWALPASLFNLPWRDQLIAAGIPVQSCISPQPSISLHAWLLLLAGLTWAGWCAGQPWTIQSRNTLCEALALGIAAIALIALTSPHVPGWPPGTGLGPFANRNQTATLFAIGAFLTVACGVERFRARRAARQTAPLLISALVWFCLLAVCTIAIARDRSRSGPLLFAGMTLAWALASAPQWKHKPKTLKTLLITLLIALSVTLLIATLFLLTGRTLIARLATIGTLDFRLKIFSDALEMIRASPWTGVGLGNFDAIFPLFRHASILQERVLHPESDWLWLAAETGLPGLLAIAALLAWIAAQAWRALANSQDRPNRPIRLTACIACAGFLIHSFFDVPAHRLGTIIPALLLLGLAISPAAAAPRRSPFVLFALRASGLALLAVGAFSLHALQMPPPWPPLDWRLYATRAQYEGSFGQYTQALDDFHRARFLEPDYAGLPFQEGIFWLRLIPRFSIEPFSHALRLVPPDRRSEMYQNILANAFPAHPALHPGLWSLAANDPSMQLIYFGWATPAEFKAQCAAILHADPALSHFGADQLRRLFPIWMNKGDPRQMAALLARHPQWLAAGYRTLAQYDAAKSDFADATVLMSQYLPPPPIPPALAIPPAEAARRFAADPTDIPAGISLYSQAAKNTQDTQALDILRQMTAIPNCPPYIHYLEARLFQKTGDLQAAWNSFAQCPSPQ